MEHEGGEMEREREKERERDRKGEVFRVSRIGYPEKLNLRRKRERGGEGGREREREGEAVACNVRETPLADFLRENRGVCYLVLLLI